MSDPALPPADGPILQKPGMSTGAKVALGCGVLVLASLGSCMAVGLYGAGAVVSKVKDAGKAEWTEMVKVEQQLTTDEGCRALYKEHPLLASSYPSEDDLINAARLWRPQLAPLPAERPDLMSGQLSFQSNTANGVNTLILTYRNTLNGYLRCFWTDGKLADVTFKSGIDMKRDGLPSARDPE
jgi:hypothetical protein